MMSEDEKIVISLFRVVDYLRRTLTLMISTCYFLGDSEGCLEVHAAKMKGTFGKKRLVEFDLENSEVMKGEAFGDY